MLFFSSKGELILIIDVQSSIVRGSVVHIRKDMLPTILYTQNVHITYKANSESGYLIKMVLSAIEEITRIVQVNIKSKFNLNEIPNHISSIHYVLSSPWVVSQAKTLHTSFDVDTPISRAYVTGMIWEERAKMTKNTPNDVSVIEEKVFDVKLNGYSVNSWESKYTRELNVSFVVSIAGKRMIDKFISSCREIMHKKSRIHFHSSLFLQHVGLQKIAPDMSDYILIHIHGELTDVAIIHANSCSFFGSYPIGSRTIIRTVAQKTKTTYDVAESTFNLVNSGDIDTSKVKNEISVVENIKHVWIDEFNKLLKTSFVSEILPSRVIMSAQKFEDFFISSFKSVYPRSSMEPLLIEKIQSFVSYGSDSEHLRLTGLYAVAIHSLIK